MTFATRCPRVGDAYEFDTLNNRSRATVTNFVRFALRENESSVDAAQASERPSACQPQQCSVLVSNSADAAAGRHRVIVRALILGLSDWRTRFLQTRTLDTSPLRGV